MFVATDYMDKTSVENKRQFSYDKTYTCITKTINVKKLTE